jgi:hypothetical protein
MNGETRENHGVLAVIRADLLPKRNLECYRYANLFGVLLRKYVIVTNRVIWDRQWKLIDDYPDSQEIIKLDLRFSQRWLRSNAV